MNLHAAQRTVALEVATEHTGGGSPSACSSCPSPTGSPRGGPPGQQLRALRSRAGLTVQQLGDLLHVSRATVGRWERGSQRPAPDQVAALARVVGVPVLSVRWLVVDLPPSRSERLTMPGLASLRRERGLTGKQVAADLGIAAATWSTWESGQVATPVHRLADIAVALGVGTDDVLAARRAPDVSGLGARCRGWRHRARMTQREAAAVLGLSVPVLSRIENDHQAPSSRVVAAMSRVYRVAALQGRSAPDGVLTPHTTRRSVRGPARAAQGRSRPVRPADPG